MEELEEKKNLAISNVIKMINEQISKEGILVGEMHFNRLKYVEKNQNGVIEISYPQEKGTYHNCCYITIEPDGKVNIDGVQTSPERRYGVTKTHNGSFNIDLILENWEEPKELTEVIEKGYGKYEPVLGILEQVERIKPVKVDCDKMYDGIGEKYDFKEDEDYKTYGWEGCGLPHIPCIEMFDNGLQVLIISPEHATELMKSAHDKHYEDLLLYTDCYGYGDAYDIALGDVDLYVMDSQDVKEQDNEEKKIKYEEYKMTVLESLATGVRFDYKGIISKELSEDKEFISQVTEILKENPNNYDVKKLKRTLGISIPLTYKLGETDAFKKAIQEMAEQASDKTSDLKEITGKLDEKEQEKGIKTQEL